MRMSDLIEEFIKDLFNDESDYIEIGRNELAEQFNCVPSQINYVISTRFKPSQGYYVESRRGGGGNIKIKKVNNTKGDSESFNRIIMLILSITLHNIPEGLAVGVAFGALQEGYTTETLMGAISVAVGIGLQNFPEGAAVSIPLRREGYSRKRSFFF